jgi:hypothetical protein
MREGDKNLLRLRVGMAQEDVLAMMGDPDAFEGYSWGMAWLYRTALTNATQGPESEFTPVVFDEKGILVGWEKNLLAEYRKR